MSTTKYFPWRIGINFSVKKRSVLKWKAELDLTEAWTRLQILENKSRTLNTCSQKNLGKTWSSRMSLLGQREFWMRNSSKPVNSGTRAMQREIKLLILDLKLQSLREILI